MAALLDKLEVPSADVLAFGEGASVALQLALRHPTRVEKLVLASPVIVHPTVADKRPFPDEVMAGLTGDTGSWLMYEASRRDPAAILDWLFPRESLRSPIQQKEARQFILDSPDQTVLFQELLDTTVPLSAREPGTRNDLVQTRVTPAIPLDKVAVPVLIVQGELDAVIPVKDIQAMAAKIPGSQLVTIPATGHLLMLGPGTEEAAQRIDTFLSTQPALPVEPAAAQP
jgi:pimeloyl-ACP methyl ester carboxylesterase